jgi:signal transduction histidine kinase
MALKRLSSIRGQLVAWYIGVLAVLLVALGVFQSITLRDYLRTSTTHSLRTAAYGELSLLGPCYIQSRAKLNGNADTLARLLGSPQTSVMIVTPSGQTLASYEPSNPNARQPLRLSASIVHSLISGVGASRSPLPAGISLRACPKPSTPHTVRQHSTALGWTSSLVSGGSVLVVAVPLGPPGRPLGYAILGRSLQDANAIASRLILVFALGALAALILATSIAVPIINRALSPLGRVTETAELIAAGNLEERANLTSSRDEVGRLGQAFDAMVDRLQQAVSATAASEERMRQFLADASHELRTPVTVLRGASQVLLRQEANGRSELTDALGDMHEEAVRLAKLVDDLLTLSRLDGQERLVAQPVDIRSALQEFVDRYGRVWEGRRITLDTAGMAGMRASVDPVALQRILTNLIDNAARYSRPGGAVTLGAGVSEAMVAIHVSDEGPGLTDRDAARVFERFYRVNKSRSRSSGGTGLGLSIVRGLVEQSGGTITIETGPERGTTVTFTLPRSATLAEQQPREAVAPAQIDR